MSVLPQPRERIVAIIPARGGSKGIPGKNLRTIGGKPLIVRTAEAARGAPEIDLVVVTSDDEAILAAARSAGARAILRPAEISGDTASSESALLHALDVLDGEGEKFDTVVFLQCTSPFTRPADVSALVETMARNRAASALMVSPNHGFLWKRSEAGPAQGINHDETRPRKRRQELAPEFRENGAGYAMKVAEFRRTGNRFIPPIALAETDLPIVEIDEPEDLEIVEAMIAKRDRTSDAALAERLKAVKLLVTDFDGVHTDDSVQVDDKGGESVRCSRRDGFGLAMLAERAGIRCMIISKEVNPVVTRRAEKLKAEVIQGVGDKFDVLGRWLATRGLTFADIAYVGNDLNDLECLRAAAVGFAPADAHHSVFAPGVVRLKNAGGNGALRELCDLILGI